MGCTRSVADAPSEPQNKNGLTETDIFPFAAGSILKSTCFCAVVSPTVTDNKALQLMTPVDLLLEFVRIVSSNSYTAPCLACFKTADFSASVFVPLTIAATELEFLTA